MTDTFGFDKDTLEKIHKEGFKIDTSWLPDTDVINSAVEKIMQDAKEATELLTKSASYMNELHKDVSKTLEKFHEVLIELHKKDTAARQIRGDVITSIIILDEILEEIILKFYVKKEQRANFNDLFYEESFSTSLKHKLVRNTGLLNPYPRLSTNIKDLIQWRNIFAHSKHTYSAGDVELFYRWDNKADIKNIQTLKDKFDVLFNDTLEKLDKVLVDINTSNAIGK